MSDYPILEIKELQLNYGAKTITQDINITLNKGEVLGIAGESGCGKSTLLKAIIDPQSYKIEAIKGSIKYMNQELLTDTFSQHKALKGTKIGLILQNPYATFNPIRSYHKQFRETLKSHNMWSGKQTVDDIIGLFDKLGLKDGARILNSCPYEMSGGMNQRIAIALTMQLQPNLLLADEPTSALDTTSQAQVVEELSNLRKFSDVSMIIVSHNLLVLANICDKISIMRKGKIVEYGSVKEVLMYPKHMYTKCLLEAIPKMSEGDLNV